MAVSRDTQNGPPLDEGTSEIHLRELWFTLVRSRWLVLSTMGIVLAATWAYTSIQKPVYEAGTTLRIDEHDAGQDLLGQAGPIIGAGKGKIETEMLVLRSRHIAETVADSLGLMVAVTEPAGPRSAVLQSASIPRTTQPGTITLTHAGGAAYTVAAAGFPPRTALPARVEPGVPFQVGDVTMTLARQVRAAPPEVIRLAVRPFRAAVADVRGGLNVFRPEPNAQVVGVGFRSTDPELAAAVPNEVTEAFMQFKLLGSKSESRSTVRFLQQQVGSYEGELQTAEERLRSFREAQQVVSLSDEASQQVQRLAQLQAQHDELRSEREALGKLLARVNEAPRGPQATSPYRQLASFPVFLSNRAVQDILQSLTELENRRADLLVKRTSENTDVQGIETRVRELEMQLYQIARNYLDGLDSQIQSAEASLGRFGSQLETIPAREVEFARLSRQQKLLADIYNLLQTRLKEAEIRDAVQPGDIRVIDAALVPEVPVAPRPMRNMGVGMVLGLLLGIGLAFTRRALDTKVRTTDDIQTATAGAPILAMIPRIRPSALAGANGNGNGNGNGKHAGNGKKQVNLGPVGAFPLMEDRLVTRLDPRSPASEAYRALRTNITFSNAERSPQVLVISSAMPGDGKSTSASNLAITLAQQGTRTILIDADLRRGVLHKVFGGEQEPGLTHVLLGKATLAEAVQQVQTGETGIPLDFLPAGIFPPNPAEILGSPRMRELLKQLRVAYEMIVIDAPPLNLVTDAAVLGTSADTTLLIARTGTTDKRALQHAATQLHHIGAAMGGVILNDFDIDGGRYYGGYGYGYGYGYGHSYRYGDN